MRTLKKMYKKLEILMRLALIIGMGGLVFASVGYADSTIRKGMPDTQETGKGKNFIEASLPAGYLPVGVLEHSFRHGPNVFGEHVMGTAYNPNTNTYWGIDGGTTPSNVYEYKEDGTILTQGTVPVDGRAIVYRHEDGNIYIASYTNDVYRLNLPFNGTVTLIHADILQCDQCGIAFASSGNIFDVNNGMVREYNFDTGAVVRTFNLNPNYPSWNVYPYSVQIASDGSDLYFFSSIDDVYVYDINGHHKATVDLNHPSFDNFNAPFSLSYTNERIYIHDQSDHLIYGYRIKDVTMAGLTISPPSGDYVTTQRFDLTLILKASGVSVVGGKATLDGVDVTAALVSCIKPGTLVSGGQTFRCPDIKVGDVLSPGSHTLDVTLDLSDGSSANDTAVWEVLGNTEP